jgi:chemotaxis response regulator CheB
MARVARNKKLQKPGQTPEKTPTIDTGAVGLPEGSAAHPSSQAGDTPLIVGIGASAGGLTAFKAFFAGMPADSRMAFVLVQHLDPNHKSLLAELIARQTAMPVREAEDGMSAAANGVFVIPPDATLTIKGGILRVERPARRANTACRSTRSFCPWPRTRAKTRSASSCPAPAPTARWGSGRSRNRVA